MNFLDELTADQQQVLIRLPYRIGLWISQSDVSGGVDADAQEMQALSNIIHGFASDVFGAEAIQFIISGTINHVDEWGGWGDDLNQVLLECSEALGLVDHYVGEKEARAFAMQMYDIGEAIAMAFTEHEHMETHFQRLIVRISYFIARSRGVDYGFNTFISISKAERKALANLSSALELGGS